MAIERTYVVPLRKGWLKSPKYRRAKKAVSTLRDFLVQHMKSEDVRILPELNEEVWKDGIKSPPPRIKITVVKDDKGVVKAQLFGKEIKEEKEEEKKGIVSKLKEKVTGKKEEKPAEETTEEKPAEVKEAVEEKTVEVKPAEEPKVEKPAAEKPVEVKPAAPKEEAKVEEKPEKKEVKSEVKEEVEAPKK